MFLNEKRISTTNMEAVRTTVIANAQRSAGKDLDRMFSFVNNYFPLKIITTQRMEDGYNIIQTLPDNILNLVVVYAGDGGVNGVVNAIMKYGKDKNILLAVVPYESTTLEGMTSGSDYSTGGLGIHTTAVGLDTLLKHFNGSDDVQIIESDIGVFECKIKQNMQKGNNRKNQTSELEQKVFEQYFANCGGIGLSYDGAELRNSGMSYLRAGFKVAFRAKPYEVLTWVDGTMPDPEPKNVTLVNVNNTNIFGNGIIVGPGGRIYDGKLNAALLFRRSAGAKVSHPLLLQRIKNKSEEEVLGIFQGSKTYNIIMLQA